MKINSYKQAVKKILSSGKPHQIPQSIPSMSAVLGVYPNEFACYATLFDQFTRDGYKLNLITGKYYKP